MANRKYRINIGTESHNFVFGALALRYIEKEFGSLNGFVREFSKGAEGPVFTCMSALIVAGLAHAGFRTEDLDNYSLDDINEAGGPVAEAFMESFGLGKYADQEAAEGEAVAASPAA